MIQVNTMKNNDVVFNGESDYIELLSIFEGLTIRPRVKSDPLYEVMKSHREELEAIFLTKTGTSKSIQNNLDLFAEKIKLLLEQVRGNPFLNLLHL